MVVSCRAVAVQLQSNGTCDPGGRTIPSERRLSTDCLRPLAARRVRLSEWFGGECGVPRNEAHSGLARMSHRGLEIAPGTSESQLIGHELQDGRPVERAMATALNLDVGVLDTRV